MQQFIKEYLMTHLENKNNNSTSELSNQDTIKSLQEQLAKANIVIEQQQRLNSQLKEKILLQDNLNHQLSDFHLTTFFEEKENKTLSVKQQEELVKAQEHIMILGNMLLKKKNLINKLKKSKVKDETLNQQITELNTERNFLWDLIIKIHEEVTQQPHKEEDCKYKKAQELLDLIKNFTQCQQNKKIKP